MQYVTAPNIDLVLFFCRKTEQMCDFSVNFAAPPFCKLTYYLQYDIIVGGSDICVTTAVTSVSGVLVTSVSGVFYLKADIIITD